MYDEKCTEFEVQSTAFSILRKHLYPKYLVRGEYHFKETLHKTSSALGRARPDIAIFLRHPDKEPELKLLIEVKKASREPRHENFRFEKQGIKYQHILKVPCIYLRGPREAFKVLELVKPWLEPWE